MGQATEMNTAIDAAKASASAHQTWTDSIVPALTEYIRIPNKSPMFDPAWKHAGHMDQAVGLIEAWCKERLPKGATIEVICDGDRTPVIFMDIPGSSDDTVLLYGHLDKQPEMVGWDEDLGPWTPVLRDDRLYGRGGADDGYSAFASVTAVNLLAEQSIPHARCVVLIEACEESGSYDLPFYIDLLADRIGTPSLVVCLDSGCGNYDQMWCTTSLRGIITGDLTVELLAEGVHSGDASGIAASSFRVLRSLLSRLENANTGSILPDDFHVTIPNERIEQSAAVAQVLGTEVWDQFPFHSGVQPVTSDSTELILNRTWRPALAVTGCEGMPAIADAGNVMRPKTAVKLSLRLPPTLDAKSTVQRLKQLLESDPPYGARVAFTGSEGGGGWNAPGSCALAIPLPERRIERVLRQGRHVHGRRRLDPVYGHAGGEVPQRPVSHHGCARPPLQRPRPQRIPTHSHRPEAHVLRRPRARRPLHRGGWGGVELRFWGALVSRLSGGSRRTIEATPVVGASLDPPFRRSKANARAIREESHAVTVEQISAALRSSGLRYRLRGSRKIFVAGQHSNKAVVLQLRKPTRVSLATTKFSYRDDWPTAIAVLHALVPVMGPLLTQFSPFDLWD